MADALPPFMETARDTLAGCIICGRHPCFGTINCLVPGGRGSVHTFAVCSNTCRALTKKRYGERGWHVVSETVRNESEGPVVWPGQLRDAP